MARDETLFESVTEDFFLNLGQTITWNNVSIEVDYKIATETEKVEDHIERIYGDINIILNKSDVATIVKTHQAVVESKTYSDWIIVDNDQYTWTVVGYDQDVT